jgi:adenine-specific DNA-methyltransferase
LLNFKFKPSQSEYWKHGIGQGNNYIYVTTQILSVGNVQQIKSYLKPNESLTICAKKFEPGCKDIDPKIIVKKIPQLILNSCEFGKK